MSPNYNNAIEASNISKKYRIGDFIEHDSFLKKLFSILLSPYKNYKKLRSLSKFDNDDEENVFWALKDISFNVKKGDIVGIIGLNGAGKSTLLKVLSKITYPSSGSIRINGRVSSLLEVGTGFHPDLTGRENIFLNGTILGMKKKEIEQNFNKIVDFSGINDFIDTPVKRYSSGMRVRLAFSIAAHLDSEILLIDEVLAVGDTNFQNKAIGKIGEITNKKNRTVLFVSHDMGAVNNICNSCIVLFNGKIVFHDHTEKAINYYLNNSLPTQTKISDRNDRRGNREIEFSEIWINGIPSGNQEVKINSMGILNIKFLIKKNINTNYEGLDVVFSIHHAKHGLITAMSSDLDNFKPQLELEEINLECTIPILNLIPGTYYINVFCGLSNIRQDAIHKVFSLTILPESENNNTKYYNTNKHGIIKIEHQWKK